MRAPWRNIEGWRLEFVFDGWMDASIGFCITPGTCLNAHTNLEARPVPKPVKPEEKPMRVTSNCYPWLSALWPARRVD